MKHLCLLAMLAVAALAGCKSNTPVAGADSATAIRGVPVDIPVLANDSDPQDRPLIVKKVTRVVNGHAVIGPDNTIRYTSLPNATGEDTFFYRVANNKGGSAWGRVTVRIVEPLLGEVPAAAAVHATPEALPPAPSTATTQPASTQAAPSGVRPASDVFLSGVAVALFTREDAKSADEPVRLTLRRGKEILAEQSAGAAEAWAPQTDRSYELELARPIPWSDATSLTLEVRKTTSGVGQGSSWVAQIDAQGRLSDGRTVTLLPKTLPFRFGAGSTTYRTWHFAAPAKQ